MTDHARPGDRPEEEIDRRSQVLVLPVQGRGMIAHVLLTSERILYSRQLFADTGRGGLAALAEQQIQKAYDERSGSPTELLRLPDIRRARKVRRRLRGDVYEFTLTDGSTCSIGAASASGWLQSIRGLLSERHGRTVVHEHQKSWTVTEP